MNKENDLELDVITSEPDEGEEVSQSETDREAKDTEEPISEGGTHRSGIRTTLTGMFRKRRLVISMSIIVIVLGSACALLWPRFSFILKGSPFATEDLVVPDGFREEKLAPFIVPLTAGEAGKLAVVNIVALWDDLTSLRFQKNEYQIRNRLYQFLVHFEERGVNLQKKVSFLQLEMSGIVRESLGIENLSIRVGEIKIY